MQGPVDLTTRVLRRLAPFEKAEFKRARREARRESSEALAFDALITWTDTRSGAARRRDDFASVLRIDYPALLRGRTERGEVCEIVGGGPIPVSVAQRLFEDSFVKAILVDGTDVLAISHLGRLIPARLRTAVEELHPECDIGGCNVTHALEIDHNQPVEARGPTALWNLGRLCTHHHDHKHRHDLRLAGEPGRMRFIAAREWVPPPRRCVRERGGARRAGPR